MLTNLIKNIFGTRNTRILKDYKTVVTEINNLEEKYQKFIEDDFTKETNNLRAQIQVNDDLSKILPNAFALVREASIRTLGLRHYDEQLMGGIALHNGKIAEMKTGEGKTLVSTLPAYLNSLKNKPVFIVTVNDYLAERDAEWMGQIFKFLGLTVGTITSTLSPDQRKEIYKCNIVYGTNNEFGFDYLRDNMTYDKNLGVNVYWTNFATGGEMFKAMLSGSIDIAYSAGLTPYAQQLNNRAKIKMVGVSVFYQMGGTDCIVSNNSGISSNNAYLLEGKTVAMPRGTMAEYVFTASMNNLGVDINKIQIIDRDHKSVAKLLKARKVAMVCTFGMANIKKAKRNTKIIY